MKITWDAHRALVDEIIACDGWLEPYHEPVARIIESLQPDGREPRVLARLIGEGACAARRSALMQLFTRSPQAFNDRSARIEEMKQRSAANPAFRAAIDAICACDFTDASFDAPLSGAAFVFATPALFCEARFKAHASLNASRFLAMADFRGAVFEQDAVFEWSEFFADALFAEARFMRSAEFRKAVFRGKADFTKAQFTHDIWLREARFLGEAAFSQTEFGGEAGLGSCEFRKASAFDRAMFKGGAGFDRASFFGEVSFAGAEFSGTAWFQQTRFGPAPNFDRAHFTGAVRLEGAEVTDARSAHREGFIALQKRFSTRH